MTATDQAQTTPFLPIAIGLITVALLGFWFTYWKPLFNGESFPALLHIHAALWFGWFALLAIQARLIRSGSAYLHRRLGAVSILYTALLIAVSCAIAVQTIARDAHLLTQLIESVPTIIPLTQIIMFTVLVGLSIANRQRREIHKRFMLLAALVAVTPALARISIGILGAPNVPLIFTVSNLLIVWVGYLDWRRNGRVHSVYLWGGLAILLVRVLRIPLAMSTAWSSVAKQLSGILSAN